MADKIRVRRGNKANLPTLDDGEFGLSEDTKELFIGSTSGNQRIPVVPPATAPWVAPTLLNGWLAFDVNRSPFYLKDDLNFVHMTGLVKSGTISVSTPVFVLPAGYRPKGRRHFSISSNSAFGALEVAEDGSVLVVAGSNVWASLEVTFRVEQ